MAPLAREVHGLPGRTRLRIDEKRGDETYFTTVENALRDYPGISAVETNSRTASVLVHHIANDPSPWQRAEEQGLFHVPENEAEMRKMAPPISATATPARKARGPKPKAAQTNRTNWRPLLFLAWVGMGIAQAIEGNIAIPAAAAFWYAYLVSRENGVSNTELG
ncbi:hypothetical protein SAMN05216299_110109 [Nitrosospira sp. Nsp14]|nr:hypothetical protein SAMN05216299_110109 [Nitrosospira sp. Nsp14]